MGYIRWTPRGVTVIMDISCGGTWMYGVPVFGGDQSKMVVGKVG